MSKNIFSLAEKKIILTGGLGLLGKTFLKDLLDFGAFVVVIDVVDKVIALKELNYIFPDFEKYGDYFQADITNKEKLKKIKDKILLRYSNIDVLINNAAINPQVSRVQSPKNSNFENMELGTWQEAIAVNLTGTMLCSQIFGAGMKKGSAIINIASVYGVVAPDQRIYNQGFIKPAHYSVTKGGVIMLTKYLAAYWGSKGVRVNCLTPGGILFKQDVGFIRKYSVKVPLGRMAKAEEMCGALIYLCSNASSYVNGANIIVDGGLSIW